MRDDAESPTAKAGNPAARLDANHGAALPRMPGAMKGEIWMAPDFESLPDDMAEAFGMKAAES
ncbi:MAG TPA: hypothetical protein VMB03_10890 [Bryobacteraceae bacterium]|nr:hypothetical protein [Bryobacteraceae bacterium]